MANADDPIGPDNPRPLAAAIAARDPTKFFEALEWVEAATRDVPLPRLPEPLRMVRVLFYLQMDGDPELGGVERFLLEYPEEVGVYARDAEKWCRDIGASRAAEYLARAIAVFPGGEVPADYGERVDAVPDSDVLEELDREYADALPELAKRLRAYFELHERELDAAIAEMRGVARQMQTLPAILAVEDPLKFLEAVVKMVDPEGARSFGLLAELPPEMLVARVLLGLYLTAETNGIWQFLAEQETGAYLPHAERWCRVIGAGRAAEYMREVASLFPGGQVPADDVERDVALEQIEDDWSARRAASPTDPALRYDPLRVLDKKYEGAMPELVEALRTHLRENATDAEQARELLAQVGRARP